MKNIILFFTAFLLTGNLMASGIRFNENKTWEQILAKAKSEKKIIFLDAYASWCGPCKYLQNSVFTNDEVGSYFNANFINVAIDMEEGEGPNIAHKYGVTAYPTLFFINAEGELLHKYVGALATDELINLGKDGLNPDMQYFTQKAKAMDGKLSGKSLLSWLKQAEDFEDDDMESIVKNYLDQPDHKLTDESVLKIALDYATNLSEDKLTYLLNHKTEVMQLAEINEDKYNDAIISKAKNFALEKSLDGDKVNFITYLSVLKKFVPNKAALETQKMKVRYAFYQEDSSKGFEELNKCISDVSLGLDALGLASLILDNAEAIAKAGKQVEFIQKIKSFKLLAADQDKKYFKDFSILSIYYFAKDTSKVKEYGSILDTYRNMPEYLVNLKDKMM